MQVEELLNEIVVHRLYGEGVVQSAEGNHIVVVFEGTKTCKFLVPSCFDKFLQLKGDDKQAEIDEAVKIWKTNNGVYKSEQLNKKMEKTQNDIKKRGEEREKKRLEKLIEESKRSRFFAGVDSSDDRADKNKMQKNDE